MLNYDLRTSTPALDALPALNIPPAASAPVQNVLNQYQRAVRPVNAVASLSGAFMAPAWLSMHSVGGDTLDGSDNEPMRGVNGGFFGRPIAPLPRIGAPSASGTASTPPPGTGQTPPSGLPITTQPGPVQTPGDGPGTVTPPASGSGGGSSTSTNTGGAGLAGNGSLIDALTAMLQGGGMQSPLDAVSSPSTAALSSLQPTAASTSSASNPALLLLIVGAIAVGGYMLWKHQKKAHGGRS